jgi:iron-sulfur cluster repair protein YtfE (RIC family)
MEMRESHRIDIPLRLLNVLIKEAVAHPVALERSSKTSLLYGGEPLAAVSTGLGIDAAVLLKDLISPAGNYDPAQTRWYMRALQQLINHFDNAGHARMLHEYPLLLSLINRAQWDDQGNTASRTEVRKAVLDWMAAVQAHVGTYQTLLLPISHFVKESERLHVLTTYSIGSAIDAIDKANSCAETAVSRLRVITNNMSYPQGAHHSYVLVLHAIQALYDDFHSHCEQEFKYLFPALRAAVAHGAEDELRKNELDSTLPKKKKGFWQRFVPPAMLPL